MKSLKESLLSDIEDTISTGDGFSKLYYWIDNFKNINNMEVNISNFKKELKKNGSKKIKDTIEDGKYYVTIENKEDRYRFAYTLIFYYPDDVENNIWRYAIINMETPKNERAEKKGYKQSVRFFNTHIYKVDLYAMEYYAKEFYNSRNATMLLLPDKYKDIIKLIDIEGKR